MQFAPLIGLVMLLTAGISHAEEGHPTIPERPTALKALDGNWVTSGDVMGKPVTYQMNAGPALQ